MKKKIKDEHTTKDKSLKGKKENIPKKYVPSAEEIEKNRQEGKSWCENEGKFVYDPKKRISCPFCGGRLR